MFVYVISHVRLFQMLNDLWLLSFLNSAEKTDDDEQYRNIYHPCCYGSLKRKSTLILIIWLREITM